MAGIRSIYHTAKRYAYLVQKLLSSIGKVTVIYTKQHPIYTSVFEEAGIDGYNMVFLKVASGKLNALEKVLLNKSKLIHADSAHMLEKHLLARVNKPVIVECEGSPYQSYFSHAEIKKILVESKTAGRGFENNDKVALCYPSIQPRVLRPEKKDEGYVTLLSVGHGGYIKGYDVLYKIYKELSKKHKVKLIIAGSFGHNFLYYPEVLPESYERENFPQMLKELLADENVIIRPFKREELIQNIYPVADVYLQFSRMETFGYSILEAMSFGLPVLACHFKAIREMVQHGENGFLVCSNGFDEAKNDYVVDINSEQWGENCFNEAMGYITTLIDNKNKRAEMGEKSLGIINEKFNLSDKKRFLENLYNDLINV
jgi:glycosyltransferase involved in cell wall biosynthesis